MGLSVDPTALIRPETPGRPRIALAHDWLVGMRGGERVLDRLAALFGPTDLFVMVSNGCPHTPAIDACRIHTSVMQHWPGAARRLRRWYLPLYPRAVRSLTVPNAYDLLLSTSSAMIKAIRPPRRTTMAHPVPERVPHLCYCHSPPRYLWSQRSEYAVGAKAKLRAAGLAFFGTSLQRVDRESGDTVTAFVANSTHTAKSIERVYRRPATVVHPPVDTDYFTVDSGVQREEFYLVVSALEPYKRIDLAVQAARTGKRRLIVVGSGSQARFLRAGAGGYVEFRGWIDRAEIRDLYRRARALLFPGIVDLGIVPVEAMACGCPVIARDEGGARDWMTDRTGMTFAEPAPGSLLDAIERFERSEPFSTSDCRANAERFAITRFDEAMKRAVAAVTPTSRANGGR